jgi:hypothetical protein
VTSTHTSVADPTTPPSSGGPRRRTRLIMLASLACVALVVGVVLSTRPAHRPSSKTQPPAPLVPNPNGLQWAPPTLSSPKTIQISATNHNLKLDDKTDYRLVLPNKPITLTGGLIVNGGHNVVLVGGTIVVPMIQQPPPSTDRRGIFLKDQTGVVHLEGLRLSGPLSDGIDLEESAGATVQIENVQIDKVDGTYETNHADVIQSWAGPTRLRIDGLRGSSDYQGLFLLPNQHWVDGPEPESFDIRRSVITMVGASAYALWTPPNPTWLHADGLTVIDATTERGRVLWPPSSHPTVHLATPGSAEAKVALPVGVPGVGYRTPGYVAAST